MTYRVTKLKNRDQATNVAFGLNAQCGSSGKVGWEMGQMGITGYIWSSPYHYKDTFYISYFI